MFELTIGEYEDMQVLGTFQTRQLALQALGQYVLDHPFDGSLHPHVIEL
jgi:hypothetical protein